MPPLERVRHEIEPREGGELPRGGHEASSPRPLTWLGKEPAEECQQQREVETGCLYDQAVLICAL